MKRRKTLRTNKMLAVVFMHEFATSNFLLKVHEISLFLLTFPLTGAFSGSMTDDWTNEVTVTRSTYSAHWIYR